MTAASSRGTRKALRDLFQSALAVLAAGGATAVIELLVDSMNPAYGVVIAFVFKILIAYAQNYLETAGKIGVLLPTTGLITTKPADAIVATTVGTVDAVTDAAGGAIGTVTGAVIDTGGNVVGSVTSQVGGVIEDAGGIVGGAVGTVMGGDKNEEAGVSDDHSGPGDASASDTDK